MKCVLLHLPETPNRALDHSLIYDTPDHETPPNSSMPLGLVAATLGHDIKNVLSIISAAVDELQHASAPLTEDKRLMGTINDSLDHGVELAKRLMHLGRENASKFEHLDLVEIVEDTLERVKHDDRAEAIHFRVRVDEGDEILPFHGDRLLIEQLLHNLLKNSIKAISGEGWVEVHLHQKPGHGDRKSAIILEVHDSGPGVAEEERHAIFKAYHTAAPESGGTGLGLVSVKACTEAHRGRLKVGDSPLGGAMFRVVLPHQPFQNAHRRVLEQEEYEQVGASIRFHEFERNGEC